MVSRKRKPNFPDRKISETFLQFAEPLLTPLGPSATKEQMNQVLQIAFTVWNAVVYESVNSDTHYLQMAQDLTKGQPEIELEYQDPTPPQERQPGSIVLPDVEPDETDEESGSDELGR